MPDSNTFWGHLRNRSSLLLARETSDGFSVSGLTSHSQHIRPSKLPLIPSLLTVLYFPLSHSPTLTPQPDALSHPCPRIPRLPSPIPRRSLWPVSRHRPSPRVAHPYTVSPYSFPLRSVSLTATHLPLLSSAQLCYLASPHFQVSLRSSRT